MLKNNTKSNRPKTGAMRFGEDWTGTFVRGDDAFAYSASLRRILKKVEANNSTLDVFDRALLESLAATLESSNEQGWLPELKDTQLLIEYSHCLKENRITDEDDDGDFLLNIEENISW